MRRRIVFLVASLIGLCQASPAIAAPQEPAAASADAQDRIPFVLVTSGGISLGSYEAGVNWALIQTMKQRAQSKSPESVLKPDLVAVSGASAGGINSVLTALEWCVDPEKADVLAAAGIPRDELLDANLIRDTWVGIGIEDLLPADDGDYFTAADRSQGHTPDSLFSRKKAFDSAIGTFKKFVGLRVFRDCRIPIGLLVTRENPSVVTTGSVSVRNQRFVIALEFVSRRGGPGRFRSVRLDNEDDPDIGTVAYLAGTGPDAEDGVSVAVEDVVKLIYASSAFPVAFSKVDLEYCTSREGGKRSDRCPAGTDLKEASFLDGGIFDNIPLGAGRVLAEPPPEQDRQSWAERSRRQWFFFIDPGNRRNVPEEGDYPEQGRRVTYGLKGMTSFLPGVLDTLGDYELYTLLRSGRWSGQSHAYLLRIDELMRANVPGDGLAGVRRPTGLRDQAFAEALSKAMDAAQAEDNAYCTSVSIPEAYGFVRNLDYEIERNSLPRSLSGGDRLTTGELAKRRRVLLQCMASLADQFREHGLSQAIRLSVLDPYGDRKLLVSSRHFAITGAYLGHFGAFLDRPFREFDYYSGIYDAAHDLAGFFCQGVRGEQEECLAREVRQIYEDLGVGRNEGARTVFTLVASHEHQDHEDPSNPWRWLNDELALPREKSMERIYRSLWAATMSSRGADDSGRMFTTFVRNLRDQEYESDFELMSRILERCDEPETRWYAPTVGQLGRRLQILQKAEVRAGESAAGLRYAALALSLGSGKYFDASEPSTFGPSSEARSDRRWKLAPYEIAADVYNRGASIAYLGQSRSGSASLDLRLTPAGYTKLHDDWSGFSQADVYASAHMPWVFVSSLGVGPTLGWLWESVDGYDRVNVGLAAYVEAFRTVRMTAGLRTVFDDPGTGSNFYLLLGISDLPGLLSRLSRL